MLKKLNYLTLFDLIAKNIVELCSTSILLKCDLVFES